MGNGPYRRRTVESLAAVCFEPHLFSGLERSKVCCGASALALITGIPPETIAKQHTRSNHFPDRFMLKFLRKHGFSLHKITTDLVINGGKITDAHVVLISQLLRKGEGTWGVMFGGIFWHNFDIYAVNGLSLINQPMLTAYVVAHPKYREYPVWYDKNRHQGVGYLQLENGKAEIAKRICQVLEQS
jgi:hypothetical protein